MGGDARFTEERLDGRGFFLDVEMGDLEVFAEELEGEAEEGLVLEVLNVRWGS